MAPSPMGMIEDDGLSPQLTDIDKPHNNDVLCGRGVTTNRHPGNEKFRGLVGLNKELYVTSTKRQKMQISRSIVEAVRSMDPPGRFLEKSPETGLYSDIGDKKAIEKTSQALRDGAASLRKQLSEDLGDPDFLSAVFDTDASIKTMSSKEKPKSKAKKPEKTAVKGHRRTKSNPDHAASARQKSLGRRHKASASDSIPMSPRSSLAHARGPSPPAPPRSQPASPMSARSMAPSPEWNRDWQRSPSFGGAVSPARAHGFAQVERSHSFESSWHHHNRPPPMPWNPHSPRHSLPPYPMHGQYYPPMSPHHHPLSTPPGYEQRPRPPMSPMMRTWSDDGAPFHAGPSPPNAPTSANSLQWGSSPMAYHGSYSGRSDLHVPALGSDARLTKAVPLSPRSNWGGRPLYPPGSPFREYSGSTSTNTPPATPKDFAPPPPSPRTFKPSSETTRTPQRVVSASPRGVQNENEEGRQECARSPTEVVVNTSFDESSKDDCVKSEVEVVLSLRDGDDDGHEEKKMDEPSDHPFDEDDDYMDPAASDGCMTPLPFDEEPISYMDITDDLLRLPIAPVGPDDSMYNRL